MLKGLLIATMIASAAAAPAANEWDALINTYINFGSSAAAPDKYSCMLEDLPITRLP